MPSAPIPQSPRLTLLHFTGALSALSLIAGCSGEPLPPPVAHASPAAPERAGAGAAPVKQARWIAYTRNWFPEEITRAPLGPTGCVITARSGYRWATPPAGKAGEGGAASTTSDEAGSNLFCGYRAEASTDRAPEDLVSILRKGEQAWLFVGESGTLYEAPGSLAPFRRTIAAPEPLCKVTGEGDVVLAVSCNGTLLRYTDPSGWQKIASPSPAVSIFDVAASAEGRAIALAFPEALFTSGDGGVTWAPARVPPVGVQAVWRSKRAGSFFAQGHLGTFEWSDKAPITQAPTPWTRPASPAKTSQGRPAAVPSMWSVRDGIAVLDGDRYAETVKPLNKGEPWRLAQGPFGGDLDLRPVPKSEDCASLHLGARGKRLFTLCLSSEGSDVPLLARQSADLGETWSEPLDLVAQSSRQIGVAVAPDGSALITGVCKPAGKGSACQPTSPLLVRADGAKLRVTSASTPKLTGLALAPAYALEGRSAYFVGPRSGDKGMALFVSHDGGATFSPRSLEGTAPRPTSAPGAQDKDEANEPKSDAIVVGAVSHIRPGEDGSVGLVVDIAKDRRVYLTTDADGGALRAAIPPMKHAEVAGVGRHLIAFLLYASGNEPGLWESTDGGATWEPMPAPPVSPGHLNRSSMLCGTSGCIFDDNFVRVGWGGAKAPDIPRLATEQRSTTASSRLTPIVCELSPDTRWTRIDHPVSPWTGMMPPLPDTFEAMRGRSAWSMLTANPATGAVSAVSATLPDAGGGEARVTTRPLLGARPAGSRTAGRFFHTLEGYVALRVPIPTDKEGKIKPGTKLRNVEVAWENYIAGTSGRGHIPDAGASEKARIYPVKDSDDVGLPGQIGGDMYLQAKLVSLKVRGAAVSLSDEGRQPLPVFLVDEQGRAESVTIPFNDADPNGWLDDVSEDMVQVGGKLFGAGIMASRANHNLTFPMGYYNVQAVLLWKRKEPAVAPSAGDSEWTWRALGFSRPYQGANIQVDGDWAYMGKATVGVAVLMLNTRKGRDFASFSALQADGTLAPPVPLATLSDLGDQPRPCTAAERESSPRFVALMSSPDSRTPNYPGLRHPVLVRERQGKGAASGSAPLTLLTGSAVTHGAPSSACVAAWEANGPPDSFASAIVSGDLTHSWMFRVIPASPTKVISMRVIAVPVTPIAALEYRPMSCRFDPSARVPEAASKEEGMGERAP